MRSDGCLECGVLIEGPTYTARQFVREVHAGLINAVELGFA